MESLLKLFELWDRRKTQVKQFSGGMRRRLEIARGLLHTPKILFLDEPTLGLDPQTRNQLWTHVKNLNETEGVTVFLTTHYMDEADRVAHRIAIIDHGRIVAQGTPAELKQQTGFEPRRGVPRAHRLVYSRRSGGLRRPDAAIWRRMWRNKTMSNDLHALASTNSSATFAPRAQMVASLGQPLLYLLILGFGFGPDISESRAGELYAVPRAGHDRHDHSVHVDLFRNRPVVGPPVRVPERNAGSPGAAHPRS